MAAETEITICNKSLAIVGANRILSRSDNTPEGRAVDLHFDTVRDAILRIHPWGFAEILVQILVDATPPPFGHLYRYAIPSDMVVLRDVLAGKNWKVSGEWILSDIPDTIDVTYTGESADVTKWDSQFVLLMISGLSSAIAYQLTKSLPLKDRLLGEYQLSLNTARQGDGSEISGIDISEGSFNNARAGL